MNRNRLIYEYHLDDDCEIRYGSHRCGTLIKALEHIGITNHVVNAVWHNEQGKSFTLVVDGKMNGVLRRAIQSNENQIIK